MNGHILGLATLSATLLESVDGIADRHETAWRLGQRPRVEDYLGGQPEPGRSVLIHELLIAEIVWRLRLGEKPIRTEYQRRFKDHACLINAAFEVALRTSLESGEFKIRLSDESCEHQAVQPPDDTCRSPLIGDRFRVLRTHAEGGLGIVSIAFDEELSRNVALKEIQPQFAYRPEARDRFVLEAEITSKLEHPGVVPIHSLGRHADGRPYYAMRLIEGMNLKQEIAAFYAQSRHDSEMLSLAFHELLDRFRYVCEVLEYAHNRGYLHCDVKPQNIVLGRFGETFLVDWGLAKRLAQPEAQLATSSPHSPLEGEGAMQSCSMIGTPAYSSPEQANGDMDMLGPPSDVYGLGATLYHLLTGCAPFEGDVSKIAAEIRKGIFPTPRSIRRKIPRALEAVCLKAMSLRPEDRYPSARALVEEIERWQANEPTSAWREPWPLRTWRFMKRHRKWFGAAFVIASICTVLTCGAGTVWYVCYC